MFTFTTLTEVPPEIDISTKLVFVPIFTFTTFTEVPSKIDISVLISTFTTLSCKV